MRASVGHKCMASMPASTAKLTAAQVRRALREVADPKRAEGVARFFKTG